jgi:hypothetical protein
MTARCAPAAVRIDFPPSGIRLPEPAAARLCGRCQDGACRCITHIADAADIDARQLVPQPLQVLGCSPVLSLNSENNGVSMSPSGSGMGLRCDDGPRGRPRFLAGTAAVAQISAHWSALTQISAHWSTSVALGMNGAIRCNVNAIGPISPACALGRLRAPWRANTLASGPGLSTSAVRRSVACRAAVATQ